VWREEGEHKKDGRERTKEKDSEDLFRDEEYSLNALTEKRDRQRSRV